METFNGPFLKEDGFVQTEIEVEGGEIENFEEGGEGGRDVIIIPAFYDSHTHIADSVVKKPPTGTIEEIVGPGGLKERELRSANYETLVSSMKNCMEEMFSYGVRYFLDFREEGLDGIKTLREAHSLLEDELSIGIMGRPKERRFDKSEIEEIFSVSDGMGLSAYRDWDEAELLKLVEKTNTEDKPLAMHCSEDVREPLEKVLDLEVHHLVHMIEADRSDLEMCAEQEVPIVICPRSNMFFGKIPDIPKMLDSGVTLSLGTDNAMITNSNMFREMETAYRVARMKGEISPIDILMMSTYNPRKTLKLDLFHESIERYLVLKYREGDPAFNVVVNSNPRDIIETVWCKDGRI
ncbi:MAG: amidohydrolase family protein [Candidatus Thermoplasmatota archaeon]|nr:amidohydrolase family protein [Candidatus Thermoplasmatota archaeon]